VPHRVRQTLWTDTWPPDSIVTVAGRDVTGRDSLAVILRGVNAGGRSPADRAAGMKVQTAWHRSAWGEEWMRFEVRHADLDTDLRDLFEQYGELVVALALAVGSLQGTGLRTTPVAPTHAMRVVHAHQDAAAQWLTERRDLAERRESITMILNVALLVFVVCGTLLILLRGFH
jgi:hypothetical protein